jgi:hypothetical protein
VEYCREAFEFKLTRREDTIERLAWECRLRMFDMLIQEQVFRQAIDKLE